MEERHRESSHQPGKSHDGEGADEQDRDPVLEERPEHSIEKRPYREGDGWNRRLAREIGESRSRQKRDDRDPFRNVPSAHDADCKCTCRARSELS